MIRCSTLLLLGAILSLGYSCSRPLFGKSQSSYTANNDKNTHNATTDQRVVLLTLKGNEGSNKSWLEIAENADESEDTQRLDDSAANYKKINTKQFSEREMQHASVSNYNPFDSRGEMYLDLSAMKKEFHYPANGHKLSDFGNRGRGYHSGVDIKAENGDNIYAAFDGVVRMSCYYGGYGNMIVIRHYNGLETVYSHNNKNLVKVGAKVRAGDVIAYAGKTGRATGYHLHFEVRVQGQVINPNLIINTSDKKLQQRDLFIYNRAGKVYASNNKTKKRVVADDDSKEEDKSIPIEEVSKESPKSTAEDSKSAPTRKLSTVHKVKSGDTLSKIARIYGTTVVKLCKANGIKENAVLRLGQKIKVN